MFKVSRGTQDCWGIAINYNPDFRDISFHFLKWYIAIGLKEETVPFEEILETLEEDEEGYYMWADFSSCIICDDFIEENEIIVNLQDEEGDYMVFCEYCLNPDLKDE